MFVAGYSDTRGIFRMVTSFISAFRALVSRIRQSHEMRKYNPFTIAQFFRKQGAQIGEGCSINVSNLGTEPYLVKIGNHVAIAPGVVFATHDGAAWLFRDEIPDLQMFGPIIIEDNCVIGANAILFPNIRIGKNAIVGAGSLVVSDVSENTIVIGVPARPFGAVEKYREKCIQRWKIQRPEGIVLEPGEVWWNSKHFSENREKLRLHLLEVFKEQLGGR